MIFSDLECPNDSTVHKRYPDPTNCARYYECYKGKKNLISCPSGFLFSSEELECDFPENVKCKYFETQIIVSRLKGKYVIKKNFANPKRRMHNSFNEGYNKEKHA